MPYKILIADDEASICEVLSSELKQEGFDTTVAHDGDEVISLCSETCFDALVLDMQMPGHTGMECIRIVKQRAPETIAVIMTAYASVQRAVEAMKSGADDYIAKPFDAEDLIEKLDELLQVRSRSRGRPRSPAGVGAHMVGNGRALHEIRVLIDKVKNLSTTVLITGESGTGKGVVAQAIHTQGVRSSRPFIHVTCSALPASLVESELFGHEKGAFTSAMSAKKGKFELAEDGTIFLDEIGTLPPEIQAKLLNVLQEKAYFRVGGSRPLQVRARILAATNEDLEAAVAAGSFRRDLYYRLNVVRIECPPLRTHKEDLDSLVPYFLDKHAKASERPPLRLLPEAMEAIRAYDWPGNVRELENTLESTVVLTDGETIGLTQLPSRLQGKPSIGRPGGEASTLSLREQELQSIIAALERNNGHRERTARDLGISLRALQYKIKRLDLHL